MSPQNIKLLAYLKNHDGITTLEAMEHLLICRLSERIRELSKYYEFSHTPEHTENARVIRYRLLNAPQVVHSLPTPPVGSPAGAASYKAWMR